MKLLYEPRASTILYNLLVSVAGRRPFLLPANICPIVPLTFLKAGVGFEFIDISPQTLHMDLDAAESLLKTGKYGGVLYAHTYGEASTPQAFFTGIKRHDGSLLIIDDRCLCVPDLQADAAGDADVLLYSTGYAKVVDLGFGGYAFCSEEIPYRSAHLPCRPAALEALENGYKAVIANRQVYHYIDSDWLETDAVLPAWSAYRREIAEKLPVTCAHRQEINEIYRSRLPVELQLPPEYQHWRFNLRIIGKQAILDALFEAGLFASSHYASLAGIMTPGRCPEAEKLAAHMVNLFNDSHYTTTLAEKTCDILIENF